MTQPFEIIKAPVITEQSYSMIESGKYVFEVNPRANKPEIKKAIEKAFNVNVKSINVLNIKGKMRRVRFKAGKTALRKKALIQLEEGQTIDIL